MITHKQACAMAYQIQLAKQTVKDILKMEKEQKELEVTTTVDSTKCGTDIPVGECGEAAPDLADSTETAPFDDTTQSEDSIPEPVRYDPEHPPLCMERALRPFNCYRNPPPDSTPTWTHISTEEYQKMREYLHMGPGDPTPDIIDLRREMQGYFNTNPNPTPERIAEVLFLAQKAINDRIKDREEGVRHFRAKQRDEKNKKILGLEY